MLKATYRLNCESGVYTIKVILDGEELPYRCGSFLDVILYRDAPIWRTRWHWLARRRITILRNKEALRVTLSKTL